MGDDEVETRSLRPIDDTDDPNGNPAGVPPASVGKPDYTPGEPGALEIVDEGPGAPRGALLHASPWDGWPASWSTPTLPGRNLEELVDTAWNALDLNASVVASMPPYLVGASPNLPDEWLDNPDPDHYNAWPDFMHQLVWDFQVGEAFVVATARYSGPGGPGTGWPARFHVVPPWSVNAELVRGRRVYEIGGAVVPPGDMLHLRYKSTVDDARGHGPLEVGRARLVAASVLLRYLTSFVEGGAVPSSVLESEEELTAKQASDLHAQWINARMSRLGLPAVLDGGVKWKATSANALDVALAELAGYTEAKIAVALGVPPFLLGLPSGGDSMTYSNVSSVYDYHWRGGLRPKVQRIMLALSQWLVPRGTLIEVNRDEYVKPGPLERAQTHEIYHRIGALSSDEIRNAERFGTASRTSSSDVLTGVEK